MDALNVHPTPAWALTPATTAATSANLAAISRVAPWRHELTQAIQGPAHQTWRIEKWTMPNTNALHSWGFYRSIGLYAARSHWRLELPDGKEIHVLEKDDHYEAHWDHVSLRRDPIGHLLADAPGLALGAALVLLLAGATVAAGASS